MVVKVVSVIAAVAQVGVVAASSAVKVGAVGVVLKPAEQLMSSNVANEVEIVSLHFGVDNCSQQLLTTAVVSNGVFVDFMVLSLPSAVIWQLLGTCYWRHLTASV